MKPHASRTARRQLDSQLQRLRQALPRTRPARGWIRAIRDSLGMSAAQLAARMGITAPSVVTMEQREASGAISLATLGKAAAALNCTVVYALVPNETLEQILRRQAGKIAARRLAQVSHTMALEAQGLTAEDSKAQYEELVEDLLRDHPRAIWAEK